MPSDWQEYERLRGEVNVAAFDTGAGIADGYDAEERALDAHVRSLYDEIERLRTGTAASAERCEGCGSSKVAGRTLDDVMLCPLCAPDGYGWQPIETAPKDGTVIIVARDTGEPRGWVRGYARWDSAIVGMAYGTDPIEIAGWISRGFTDPPGELGLGHPTHWQPLPPAPARTEPSEPT